MAPIAPQESSDSEYRFKEANQHENQIQSNSTAISNGSPSTFNNRRDLIVSPASTNPSSPAMSDSEELEDSSPGTQSPNLIRKVTGSATSHLREDITAPLSTPPAKSKETPFYDETDEKRLQEVSKETG